MCVCSVESSVELRRFSHVATCDSEGLTCSLLDDDVVMMVMVVVVVMMVVVVVVVVMM